MRASRRPRAHSPAIYDRPVRKQAKVQSLADHRKFTQKPGPSPKVAQFVQRLVLLAAGVAAVVCVLGFVYYTFFLPASWDENTSKNIVIVPNSIDVSTNSILYASISYKQDKMTLQSLPAEDIVQVPGGYGQYPLKSVYPLLGLDHKSPQAVVATYSFLIGVPIDEVWVSGDEKVFSPNQTAKQFADAVLWNRMATGLDLKDRLRLSQFVQKQQPKEQTFPSLADWQAKQTSRFAGQLKDCRVALVNTTTVSGLGRKVSTVLERSGVVVVRLTDATPEQPKSKLTIQPDQPDCVQLAAHLKQLFPDQIEVQQDPSILSRSRSEAEIVIGEDLGEFLAN